jgi:hypothetical protein
MTDTFGLEPPRFAVEFPDVFCTLTVEVEFWGSPQTGFNFMFLDSGSFTAADLTEEQRETIRGWCAHHHRRRQALWNRRGETLRQRKRGVPVWVGGDAA